MKRKLAILLFLLLFGYPIQSYAFLDLLLIHYMFSEEKKQPVDLGGNFIFGVGSGTYQFSEVDDIRRKEEFENTQSRDIKNGTSSQAYLELYFTDNIGIGYRYLHAAAIDNNYTWINNKTKDDYMPSLTNVESKTEVEVEIPAATAQIILFTSKSKETRLGILGGIANGHYFVRKEVTETYSDGTTSTSQEKMSSNGRASIGGIFIDGGGDTFGMRAGFTRVVTRFKEIETKAGVKYRVNGSGDMYYIDLRWIF